LLHKKQILASFDISLVPADQRETEITPVVDAVVSPLLQLATASAAALGKLDGEIFQVNVLHAVQNALILFPFTSRRAQTFEGDIDKHVDAAASEKVTPPFFLREFLLAKLVDYSLWPC